ncbi:MAG: glucose/sorbosone family PQQ-dependent dehydrogenase [Devosia sp.]
MKTHLVYALLACTALAAPAVAQSPDSYVTGSKEFTETVLIQGLDNPWEITLGPDGMLWTTERTGKRISRIDPATGEQHIAITIDEVSAPGGQDGLMGLALHPELGQGTGNDYVYAAYSYVDAEKDPDPQVPDPASPYHQLYTKIVQLTYNEADGTLGDPVDLITGLPASNDHNSGRLKVGPDNTLYYTLGDQGNNQGANVCLPIEAQRLPTVDEMANEDYVAYVGKSLRLNLDGSIPDDNPELDGVKSHVFTYGHRNMQGIAFGPDGTLYATEHGPKTDDEVNILTSGGNYGWPNVAGFKDDKAYEHANWELAENPPCEETKFSEYEIPDNVPTEPESAFTGDLVEPIATMFTVETGWNFVVPDCKGIDFICWPTVGITSVEYYEGGDDRIPGWDKVLLAPTLKRGSIYVLPLGEDGQVVDGIVERYFQTNNRYRDVAVSTDGKSIYVATDATGLAENVDGGTTSELQNPGEIIVLTYTGEGDPANVAPSNEQSLRGQDQAAAGEEAAPAPGKEAAVAGDLPSFTEEQVAAGKTAFNASCSVCHGDTLTNNTYGPPLAGEFFQANWEGRTGGELVEKSHTMPPSAPDTLSAETYAAVSAYILSVNGLPAGSEPLTRESTGTISFAP